MWRMSLVLICFLLSACVNATYEGELISEADAIPAHKSFSVTWTGDSEFVPISATDYLIFDEGKVDPKEINTARLMWMDTSLLFQIHNVAKNEYLYMFGRIRDGKLYMGHNPRFDKNFAAERCGVAPKVFRSGPFEQYQLVGLGKEQAMCVLRVLEANSKYVKNPVEIH